MSPSGCEVVVKVEPCHNPLAKDFVVNFRLSDCSLEHLDNIHTDYEDGERKFSRIGQPGTSIIKEIFAKYEFDEKLLLFIYPSKVLVVVAREDLWENVEPIILETLSGYRS